MRTPPDTCSCIRWEVLLHPSAGKSLVLALNTPQRLLSQNVSSHPAMRLSARHEELRTQVIASVLLDCNCISLAPGRMNNASGLPCFHSETLPKETEEAKEENSEMASGRRSERTGHTNWKINLDEGKEWKASFLEGEIHIHH